MRKLFMLLAAGMALAGVLTATGSAAGGTAKAGPCTSQLPGKMGRFSGIVSAQEISGCDGTSRLGAQPPLLWGGGPVMANDPAHPITITPIYWSRTVLTGHLCITTPVATGTSSTSTWRMSP